MTTMIVDPPRRTSLGVGLDANRGRTNREAWKEHIGSRQVPARLALLPDAKPNWGRVGFSAILQLSILGFFLMVPLLYPESMKTALHFYSSTPILAPVTEIPVAPTPPPPPPPKAPKVEMKAPAPVEPPKLNPQQPHIFANLAAPKVQPKIEKVDPKVEPEITHNIDNFALATQDKGPKRPKDDVKTGNLGTGSGATPTIKPIPLDKVQTGGFGDPNGIPGKGDPNHATNVNRLGDPGLPGGPGYGNGTGGKEGVRGVVPSTGFGSGVATPPTGGSGKKTTTVASAGFSSTDTSTEAPKKKTGPAGPADTSPQILDKPRPEYTADGRSMKIEGDVVIDLVFLANGSVQINKVVSGLGHGLDESAVRAAQQIKFKPAKREGEPVDFPARVRIEFRLAY
ncbi:MAG TPA: energy transducer TonB [Candidatus Saccharimonadales bacterium]|nr:energy transducer TonB [Candidatus Saccharimonadales bacterium]